MVQMADLCAVALRRYCENGQTDIFRRIFTRADRFAGRTVGVRHLHDSHAVAKFAVLTDFPT